MRAPLRARVTYTWGAWFYRLQTCPEFIDYICPTGFPTALMAADAARRELAIRAEPDMVRRALMRLGVVDPRTRSDFALTN